MSRNAQLHGEIVALHVDGALAGVAMDARGNLEGSQIATGSVAITTHELMVGLFLMSAKRQGSDLQALGPSAGRIHSRTGC